MKDITTEEAIKMLEKYITEHKFYNIKQSDGLEDNIKILLDLYQHKKGTIDELKQELLQEKEKNKKLQIRCKELIEEKQELNTALLYDNISKDRIADILERYKYTEVVDTMKIIEFYKAIQELLEEK